MLLLNHQQEIAGDKGATVAPVSPVAPVAPVAGDAPVAPATGITGTQGATGIYSGAQGDAPVAPGITGVSQVAPDKGATQDLTVELKEMPVLHQHQYLQVQQECYRSGQEMSCCSRNATWNSRSNRNLQECSRRYWYQQE